MNRKKKRNAWCVRVDETALTFIFWSHIVRNPKKHGINEYGYAS
jgi:hypothetical protein